TAPATGTYYVKVIHYDFEDGHDSDEAGSVGQYDISVKAVPRTAAGTLVISPSGATADSVRTITLTYTPGENLVNGSVRFTVPFEIQIALNSSDTVSTAGADPIPLTDGQMGGSEDEGIRTVTVSGINATTSQTVVLTLLNKTVPQPGVYNFSATADADGLAEEKSDSAGTGNESVTFTSNATGTAGTIAVNPATYTVAEDGGSISITVTRTGGSAGAVSVGYTTVDGTAVQPGDYTQTSGALSWADGDTVSKVISVPVIDDAGVESPETFTVVISSPTGGATLGSSTATVTINSDDTSGNTPQGLDIDVSFGSIDVGMSITGSQGPLCYADIAGSLDTSQSKLIISDSSGNQQDIEVTLQQLIDHGFIDQLESEMCIKGNPGLYGAADGSFTSGGLLEDFVPFEHDQVTIILKAADSSWTLTDTVKIPYLDLTASPSGSNLVINIGSNYELDISGSYNNVPLLSATGANFASAMANAGTIGDKAGNPGAIKAFFLPAGDMGGITSLSATLNSADPDTITVSAAKSASGNVSTSIMMFIVDTDNGSLDHLILNLSGTGGSTMVAVTEGAGGPPGGEGGGGSVGTVTLTNPDNQNNNTFAGVTSATGVKLFAFSLDLTDEGVGIGQITIAANNVNGVNIADVSNLKVFIDMDNDGVMDAGEQVTTDGAGGTIGGGPFSLNTTGVGAITGILIGNIQIETFTSGHDIIIQGDVANLSLEDTVTFSVNPADITGVTGLNSGQPITPGGVLVTGVPHIKNS
ncbi:MAG: BslA/BslB family hydrophobin, partial [Bacillota bacterium]